MDQKIKEWKTISSKQVYKNPWYSVRHDEVIKPNGEPGIYGVVEGRNFVEIIPEIDGNFYLTEQYRYPVQKLSLEFPAGSIEAGETPEQAAIRELKEECGLSARKLTYLGFAHVAPGHNTVGFHVFLAEHFSNVQKNLEAGESDLIRTKMTRAEIELAIKSGRVIDGPTISAWCLYQLHFKS